MNKDVIYIEPEDDIIDVINRIKSSEQKVVAIVPPKKLGILRSAVNIKLIMKTSKQHSKVVVLVTSDPSVLKLAATVGIPVAKTLQSRPVIPKLASKAEAESKIETIEGGDVESEGDEPAEDTPKPAKKQAVEKSGKKSADINLNSSQLEDEADKKSGKKSSKDKKDEKKIPNFDKYRKFIIIGAVAAVALVGFLVWAFGFSASADIVVKMRTSSSGFAENINFVSKESEIDAKTGKLLLEKVEYSKESKIEFVPTGEKDFGNKATGKLTVIATMRSASESYSIPKGSTFAANGLEFATNEDLLINWPNGDVSLCTAISSSGCTIEKTIGVTAVEGGEKYNIGTLGRDAWKASIAGIAAYNSTAFAGGSSDVAKVVTKEDIEKAKNDFTADSNGKEELLAKINSEDVIAIDSSYAIKTEDPVSSPKEGEKVTGEKATLSAKTTYTIFVVSKSSVKEFITASIQPSLGSDQKIYDIGTPFFERFVENEGKYTAKLKTNIKTGPEVSEKDILEKVRGKSKGEIQSQMNSINGISKIDVEMSYPWVTNVPDDESKITISIEVEE